MDHALQLLILTLVEHDLAESKVDCEPELLVLSFKSIKSKSVHLLLVAHLPIEVSGERVQDVIDGIGDIVPGNFVDQVKHPFVEDLHLVKLSKLGAQDNDMLLRFEPVVDLIP